MHFATEISSPDVALYSCCLAGETPRQPEEIRRLAVAQWTRPVEFRRTIEAMHIPILEYAGFEADDVIGTISRRAEEGGAEPAGAGAGGGGGGVGGTAASLL